MGLFDILIGAAILNDLSKNRFLHNPSESPRTLW